VWEAVPFWLAAWSLAALGVRLACWPQQTGMESRKLPAHSHRAGVLIRLGPWESIAGIALPAAALVTPDHGPQPPLSPPGRPLRMWAGASYGTVGLWSGDHRCWFGLLAPSQAPDAVAAGVLGEMPSGDAPCRPAGERAIPLPGAGGSLGAAQNRCLGTTHDGVGSDWPCWLGPAGRHRPGERGSYPPPAWRDRCKWRHCWSRSPSSARQSERGR